MPRQVKDLKPQPAQPADYGNDMTLWCDRLAAHDRGDQQGIAEHDLFVASRRWLRDLGAAVVDAEAAAADARHRLAAAYRDMRPPQEIAEAAAEYATAARHRDALKACCPVSRRGEVPDSHDPVAPADRALRAGARRRRWATGVWAIDKLRAYQRSVEDGEAPRLPDGISNPLTLDEAAEPARELRRRLAGDQRELAALTDTPADRRRGDAIRLRIARAEAALAGQPPPGRADTPDDILAVAGQPYRGEIRAG